MTYSDSRQERKDARRWMVWGIFFLFGGFILIGGLGFMLNVFSAPARVITKTLGTDNIIQNYEWFYDTANAYNARVGQIRSQIVAMKAAKDSGGDFTAVDRYRVELEGMRQSCRELSAKYNANAAKVNRNIFKTDSTPERLDETQCNI